MLLAADPVLSSLASDTGFFGGNRQSQSGTETFSEAYPHIQSTAPSFAPLFEKAWNSRTLAECPSASELYSAIVRDAAIAPKRVPGVQWVKSAVSRPAASRVGQPFQAKNFGSGATSPNRRPKQATSTSWTPPKSPPPVISAPGVSWGKQSPVVPAPPVSGPAAPAYSRSLPKSSPSSTVPANAAGPVGIGGWLALLLFVLIAVNPIQIISAGDATLKPSNLLAFLSIMFAGFSIFTGINLWRRRNPKAIRITKYFLGFTVAYGFIALIVALSADLPQDLQGTLVAQAVMEWLYAGIWFLYLINSKRVLATYGTN